MNENLNPAEMIQHLTDRINERDEIIEKLKAELKHNDACTVCAHGQTDSDNSSCDCECELCKKKVCVRQLRRLQQLHMEGRTMKHLIVIYPNCVGTIAHSDDCEIDLKTMQDFVGGPIETIPAYRAGYVLIVNEEHKILGNLKINMRATRILSPDIKDALFGTALLMKVEGEELVTLDREDAKEWLKILQ